MGRGRAPRLRRERRPRRFSSRNKSDLISRSHPQRERQRSDREASAQARDRRSPENYLHALLASGPSVFRAIRHGGSLYRGDDEARAASQLHLQTHRWVFFLAAIYRATWTARAVRDDLDGFRREPGARMCRGDGKKSRELETTWGTRKTSGESNLKWPGRISRVAGGGKKKLGNSETFQEMPSNFMENYEKFSEILQFPPRLTVIRGRRRETDGASFVRFLFVEYLNSHQSVF